MSCNELEIRIEKEILKEEKKEKIKENFEPIEDLFDYFDISEKFCL